MSLRGACWRWLALASVGLATCGGGGRADSIGVPDGPRQPLATGVRHGDPTAARLPVGLADCPPADDSTA